ncbi:MAG: metallophosphoesterase family protein [Bryobacterales bacterium]|nr:metallophosphoesterase family protein [Bryobacterales bacterium]
MRILILSDLHSNYEALEAVVEDAAGSYDEVVCLGDVVGYGGDPNRVTEWVRANTMAVIRGNHDRACTGDAVVEWFSGPAQIAAEWTNGELTGENRRFLEQLPAGPLAWDGVYLMHGSPRDEDEYIVDKGEAARLLPYLPGDICFFGHTHIQGGFGLRRGLAWRLAAPADGEHERVHQMEPDTLYLLNPGSVGQPRDMDRRAAYGLYDTEAKVLALRRTPYDIERARKRILEASLPAFLADRLAQGR